MRGIAGEFWHRLSQYWGNAFPQAEQWQPWGATRRNRYPRLFAAIAERLAERPAHILSFGCSKGDEIFTLRDYLPQARLRGLDINAAAVRLARHRLAKIPGAHGIDFAVARNTEAEPAATYDAVFACAVFRHARLNHAPPCCAPLLRFAQFDAAMADFARIIRPGGYLVLRSVNFRLADTIIAHRFQIEFLAQPVTPVPPIYGPDDCLMPGIVGDEGIYRLLPERYT